MDAKASKFVFSMSPLEQRDDDFLRLETSMAYNINIDIRNMLMNMKNTIKDHYWNSEWDRHKKKVNDYELVYTDGCHLSSYTPISRSFFKMWEILHDFKDELGVSNLDAPCKALFLADGPGGFIEAFCKYRGNKHDDIYGITLLSKHRGVPSWKLNEELLNKFSIKLLSGKDGTGSLYRIHNIQNMVETIGRSSCSLITADGGFDFSLDFNNQERSSLTLILCEVYSALLLQAPGGSFVMKIYDCFTYEVLQVLTILRTVYTNMYICKPHTSRPANSEKYIICTGFLPQNLDKVVLQQIHNSISSNKWKIKLKPQASVVDDIVVFNTHFVCKQILEINKVLKSIVDGDHSRLHQLECAVRWCHKYKIIVDANSLIAIKGSSIG